MAGVLSKGITLKYNDTVLTELQEIPSLGGEAEAIEITTLDDAAHMYMNGLLSFGDSLAFKFLYAKEQFNTLVAGGDEAGTWVVTLPDGTTCTFTGVHSVALDSVGVNAPLTYTLSVKPQSEMVWA